MRGSLTKQSYSGQLNPYLNNSACLENFIVPIMWNHLSQCLILLKWAIIVRAIGDTLTYYLGFLVHFNLNIEEQAITEQATMTVGNTVGSFRFFILFWRVFTVFNNL